MSGVVVRHWAAARAAAGGLAEEQVAAVATLAELEGRLADAHGPGYAAVLARCSFLVDEVSPGTRDHAEVPLVDGAVVDVLPPFAGGCTPTAVPAQGTATGRAGLGCP
jgi:molybdopterin converting factor small subunit